MGSKYYLNCADSSNGAHSAETWHKILGHCNMHVFELESVVEGMKITTKPNGKPECDTCIKGKMSQFRKTEPDSLATAPLE